MTVQRVPSSSRFAPLIGFCAAVRAGDFVHLSGVTAIAPDGSVVGENDPATQATECIRKLEQALAGFGAGLDQVISTRLYVVDVAHWPVVGEAHGLAFRESPPASTMLVVKQLLDDRMLIEIEAVGYLG